MSAHERGFNLEPPVYDYGDNSFRSKINEAKDQITKVSYQVLDWWNIQPFYKKALLVLANIFLVLMALLSIVYHETLVHYVVEYSDKWSKKPISLLIIAMMLFIISFPPLIGFSFTNTMAGAFYGVSFKGWSIIAFGSITGSVAAFIFYRYILKSRAHALISSNQKLYAFSTILQENNSFWILTLIRLCPFPYSLTNGALAAIPGVSILNFTLGSVISSPKLVIYLFIGAKLKDLGEAKDTTTKIIDFASIILTFVFLILTGWILYMKTNKKMEELRVESGFQQSDENQNFENFLENDSEIQSTGNTNLDTEFDIDDFDRDTNKQVR
ncbi:Golgi apparatus membrane protein [Wickerhamomyces ciferrii]|uniref:Golgi apparatus membrane protein TVP38 n=1 Tax=Wickerhamomyces ciferrii (strain ATCC 14091 / BCRC 22168 / CBS 111 / JCM 3599 / NBRC 0793 / NRRL Y-1031 F-60-10) TaxID=1206466 RepID=K0KJ51_WICCF|nr:Golgi apparatus membrane protein [Wickerhamomyces ciferrii]CCH42996.1 Golgi apparatus membrane protein [Wickerhamomyces ciferrii]